MKATCASLNFDLFMVVPRSVALVAERENSSSNRSSFPGGCQKELIKPLPPPLETGEALRCYF